MPDRNNAPRFDDGILYEPYVGRWSRLVAEELVRWLDPPQGLAWLDVGCGTGALTRVVAERCAPRRLAGIDASAGFLDLARRLLPAAAELQVADATSLPFGGSAFDRVVSGLVLNFLPDHGAALAEMARVTRPGGEVAIYVWDYAHGMELMRHFWEAAVAVDPRATEVDERQRFPVCRPRTLRQLLGGAGLDRVEDRAIDVPTVFRDFDDYWSPFLGGQGPAPGYCVSLSEEIRTRLRERLRQALPTRGDGSIHLVARAWAVRGRRP
jgi:SAM-dependent methyltransferase